MRRVAQALEDGAIDGLVARAASRVWARASAARLVKSLTWRAGARVIAIGGATLGGSGKTPLALACARLFSDEGVRVAIVGHGYRARPNRPRVVTLDDSIAAVGDEARACARVLPNVPVVVAPTRQAALDLALRVADIAILDGVHQTAPRACLALLATDARAPWGSDACPPRGDLRAPRGALVAIADQVVAVESTSRGAVVRGTLVEWPALRAMRVGLVTALARPSRVVAMLAREGIHPLQTRTFPDHARPRFTEPPSVAGLDLWLSTGKCAESLGIADGENPLSPYFGILEHRVVLPPACRLTVSQLGSYLRDSGPGPQKSSDQWQTG